MANATIATPGLVNGTGTADALFLKVFGGEVITSFERNNVMKSMVQMRTIASGKSAQFPRTGKIGASYHTPGNEITGLNVNHAEIVITIDDLLISHAFIANIDEAKNHYDVRSIYSAEIGRALATQWDKHLLQLGVLGARLATDVVTGLDSKGTVILTGEAGLPTTPDLANNGGHLAAALFIAARKLDEKDVPSEDRYVVVRPAQYYALASTVNNINKDWGGQGAFSDGTILRVAGFNIVKSNNLPAGVVSNGSVDAGTANRYAGTFTNTVGLAFHKSALGTVKLMDLAMESAYDIRRQGTLMVAKYAVGHGTLRNEALVEIRNSAT